jgi:hypothetical protein
MSVAYSLLVALHVLSLIFCAGPVLALALVPGELSPPAAQRLSRVASFGLLGILLTGGAALAMTGPAFVHTWWLRLSVLLFLVIGALTGRLRRLIRNARSASGVRPIAWAITVALALVVYLMEGKPF